MVDGTTLPAWQARALEAIRRDGLVELALVVRACGVAPDDATAGRVCQTGWRSLLARAWLHLDRKRFGGRRGALQAVDAAALLHGVPAIDVRAETDGGFDVIVPADAPAVADYRLDVLLRFSFRALRGKICDAARCGVWYYGCGEDATFQCPLPAVWEVLLRQPTTATDLLMVAGGGADVAVLERSWSPTDTISPARTLDRMLWKCASYAPRRLRELGRLGPDAFLHRYRPARPEPVDRGQVLPPIPGNLAVLRGLGTRVAEKLAARVRNLVFFDQWMLMYRITDVEQPAKAGPEFTPLVPPKDRFWADPFVVQYQGQYAVFIEECEYADSTGYLSVIGFNRDGAPLLPPRPIMKRPYHLSYPFVFEDGGTLYMIPESAENEAISIYRCRSFPDEWEFVMNLLERVTAYDSTIWRHNGRYWLFATVCENREASSWDEVFLYHSDSLLSRNWIAHPCNPIVSDVRCARPAGRIFEHRGAWYRPAQDCSRRYGGAIDVRRIEAIDEHTYREVSAGRIEADWHAGLSGIHTLNHAGRLTCIDVIRRRPKWPAARVTRMDSVFDSLAKAKRAPSTLPARQAPYRQ
ncbi:MAG TPA: hypothetical protein VM406_10850 [Noviherbaspirillum sp.]|nr:hypothetical protein [Noviherbaspirillum sp.]